MSVHNGGISQVGLNFPGGSSGEFPFLNILKGAPNWSVFDNSANPVPPDILDADGYPTAIQNGGVSVSIPIPSQSARPGNYCITWDGTGTISSGAGGSTLTTKTFTGSISGNVLNIPGAITGGPFQFGEKVTGTNVAANTIVMNQIDSTHFTVSQSQTVASTSMTASGGSSTSSGTTNAGFLAFTIAANAIVFKITTLPSAPSNYISNVKIFHVNDAALVQAGQVFGTQFKNKLIEAKFGVIRFLNWQSGNTSTITDWSTRKSLTHYTWSGTQWRNAAYCGQTTNVGAAYSVAAPSNWPGTSGGLPPDKTLVHVRFNASSASTAPTLAITGGAGGDTSAITIVNEQSNALSSGSNSLVVGGTHQSIATLIYDATLNVWIKHGGDVALSSCGIDNGVPYEMMVQLCDEIGAHPYFVSPVHALDPATDFIPSLAQYCKQNCPSWMIPRQEGPNETWNTGPSFDQTTYATNKSAIEWSGGNYHSWYGKVMSTIGQSWAAVYGPGNLATAYHVICGVQTSTGGSASNSNERLSAAKYVAQAAAAQSLTWGGGTINFTKSAASGWVSHICCAQYVAPSDRYSINDLINGFSYSVTHRGDATAQATVADAYADTLTGAADGHFNLAQCSAYYQNWQAWAAGFGVTRMCGYEGGYSPDYLKGLSGNPVNTAWYSTVSGATQDATGCVLTLGANCVNSELASVAGNPGVAGMAVVLTSIGGMTQLNNPALRSVTFAGAGSANISGTNTLIVNQAVYFYGTLPNELTAELAKISATQQSIPYYVVSAGNPFQISATRGGAPIVFNSTGSSVTAQECWFIASVPDGTHIKLDVDSSGFSAYSSGGFSVYVNSQVYSNNLRWAGKQSSRLLFHTRTNYNNFVAAGGEFPSAYQFGGPASSNNVWSILEDVFQSPNPPQLDGIKLFNAKKRRLIVS